MRRCLLFISLMLLLQPAFCEEGGMREYGLTMLARGQEIEAICVMNTEEDGSIVGTVVNQMGLKAFDFTYTNGKAQVLNVVAFLDKWYIRKVLRKDFSFILQNLPNGRNVEKGKRRMTLLPNGDIEVVNGKYKIQYVFSRNIEN